MKVRLSKEKPVVAIAGHAGCGHCNSHKQYLQEDSVGLATVLALFQEATDLSLMIKKVRVKTGVKNLIEVETESGGIGRAFARRGITFHEGNLARSLVGKQAIRTQTIVAEAFGRFYGQGVHETPVALQTAVANAAVDSFIKKFPENFVYGAEDTKGSCGLIAGAVLDFDGIPAAVLATVNASSGGIGPNEDLEGNCAAGSKYGIMEKLQMLTLPTLVVEGKVYWPTLSDHINESCFLVRAAEHDDNVIIGAKVAMAAKKLGYPVRFEQDSLARAPGALRRQTKALGERIAALGCKLQQAEYAQEKVNVLADLAKIVSEDGAGISFMSNGLHELIGGVGMNPGSSAVLSYIVPRSYYEEYIMPFATERDLHNFVLVSKAAVGEMQSEAEEAQKVFRLLDCTHKLDGLILKG